MGHFFTEKAIICGILERAWGGMAGMSDLKLHPIAELFPRMADEEFESFVEDVKRQGILQPILVRDGLIIDGRHRWEAARQLGIECPIQEWNGQDPWLDAQSFNLARRHLPKDQIYAIRKLAARDHPEVARPIERVRAEAKDRMVSGVRQETTLGSRDPRVSRSADLIGSQLGMSGVTVKRVDRLEREAPEMLPAVARGEMSAVRALREVNYQKRQEIQKLRIEEPTGRYQCLVVDPPWKMEKIERDERPGQEGFDYPAMSEDELAEFPIPNMAEEDAHLYLWTTQKHLPVALRLAEEWGFKYQCVLTWVKNVGFTPFSWMYSTEHIIFARRGSLDMLKLGVRLDFAAKVREHSRKPEEFYDIVRRVSPGPRIDVFSREKREGFEQHGNERERF
jgi:N6-adenosine-specific RNA methylase IME4